MKELKTAILFIVFNRPEPTREVFECIRHARPSRLYIAADGPREDRLDETSKVNQVREIFTSIDWPCKVQTRFQTKNLGCKNGVSSAISWFFENEEQGIILEDDCLPSQSFFEFCQELLEYYKHDTRIWQICGSKFFPEAVTLSGYSYFFSRYGPIWGWATWRRAWCNYDSDLRMWQTMKSFSLMQSVFPNKCERQAKLRLGDMLSRDEINTWDYQWGFAKNFNSALSIIPSVNLVRNIGFSADATHTTSINSDAPRSLEQIPRPISHPPFVIEDRPYQNAFANSVYPNKRLLNLLTALKQRILPKP